MRIAGSTATQEFAHPNVARPTMRESLERSSAFHALSADRQRALAENMASVADYLAAPANPAAANALVHAVDFPNFVDGLIKSTFEAIVDASIQQMHEYAELIGSVANSVHRFATENSSGDEARDHLAEKFPDLDPPDSGRDNQGPAPGHRYLVASALASGIDKILKTA
jgi:hypothetical protein